MGRNQFWPDDDGRRWTYRNIGYRRGGYYRPHWPRRRWRPYRQRRWRAEPPSIARAVIGILALCGAIALGGIFVALVNHLAR
jgi:hypothetical protein